VVHWPQCSVASRAEPTRPHTTLTEFTAVGALATPAALIAAVSAMCVSIQLIGP